MEPSPQVGNPFTRGRPEATSSELWKAAVGRETIGARKWNRAHGVPGADPISALKGQMLDVGALPSPRGLKQRMGDGSVSLTASAVGRLGADGGAPAPQATVFGGHFALALPTPCGPHSPATARAGPTGGAAPAPGASLTPRGAVTLPYGQAAGRRLQQRPLPPPGFAGGATAANMAGAYDSDDSDSGDGPCGAAYHAALSASRAILPPEIRGARGREEDAEALARGVGLSRREMLDRRRRGPAAGPRLAESSQVLAVDRQLAHSHGRRPVVQGSFFRQTGVL